MLAAAAPLMHILLLKMPSQLLGEIQQLKHAIRPVGRAQFNYKPSFFHYCLKMIRLQTLLDLIDGLLLGNGGSGGKGEV